MVAEIEELKRVVAELKRRMDTLEAGQRRPPAPLSSPVVQEKKVEGWIAGYGFARLGIISLVTGVAFLVADSYAWLGAPMKILLGYCVAAVFVMLGRRMLRKSAALSQMLTAGGLGIAYYTTYAMHYVPSAKILHSPGVALVLLAAMVIAIVVISHRMQSETVAGVALFLGLHTGMVSPIGSFTLVSSVLLACGAAFFLAKNRWVYVPVSTLLAVYATHLLWILGNPMIAASSTHALGHLTVSIAFAALYFTTFSVALVLASRDLRKQATVLFALLNWAALVGILCFEYSTHNAGGLALTLLAVASGTALLAFLSNRQQAGGVACEIQLVLAATSLALAAWVGASGVTQVVLAWCGTSLVTLAIARALRMRLLHSVSAAILVFAFVAQLPQLGDLNLAALLAITTMLHHALLRITQKRFGFGQDPSARSLASSYGYASALAWLSICSIASGVPSNLVVLCWLAAALTLFAVGTRFSEFSYRMAGFAIFAISFLRLFVIDMASLASGYRIAAFLALGIVLLGISYASTKRVAGLGADEEQAIKANVPDRSPKRTTRMP